MAVGAHLHLCSRTISRQAGIVSFPHPSPEVSSVQFNIIRSFLCLEPGSPDFQQGIFKYTMFHSILKFLPKKRGTNSFKILLFFLYLSPLAAP